MRTLRLFGLVAGFLVCAMSPAQAEGPEWPVKPDGSAPCGMIATFGDGANFYLSTVKGVPGTLQGSALSIPAGGQAKIDCPKVPGQYYLTVTGTLAGAESPRSFEAPFVITGGPTPPTETGTFLGQSARNITGPGSGLPAVPAGANDLEIRFTGLKGVPGKVTIQGQLITGIQAIELWSTTVNAGSWTAVYVPGAMPDNGSVFFEPADNLVPGWKTTGPFTVNITYPDLSFVTLIVTGGIVPPPPPGGYEVGATVTVTANLLTVRATPSPTGAVMAYVSKGATGVIVEGAVVVGTNTYLKVKFTPTLTGWVSKAFLTPFVLVP